MVVFFVGGTPIIAILIILLALLFSGANAVNNILPYFCGILIIKDIVLDFYLGIAKKHMSVLTAIFFFICDCFRKLVFFYVVRNAALTTGLAGIFGLILVVVLGGIAFLIFEFMSISHGLDQKILKKQSGISPIIVEIMSVVLFSGIMYLFY